MDVSILVISYNTREMTLACLRSALEETSTESEIIVVDNASTDGSADAIASEFPQIRLIRSPENLGFAGANNLAAGKARGEWILLLNPDTEVLDRAIDELVDFARGRGERGIYGGRTLFPDRTLNPASCWGRITFWSVVCEWTGLSSLFRRNALFDPESLGRWPRDTERTVDIVSGCFLLVSRQVWDELGGFDADFFMYGEDADLCQRALARGIRAAITPRAQIIHHGGASEPVRADKLVRLLGARTRLVRRHWWRPLAPLGVAMIVGRAGTRALAWKALSWLRSSADGSARCWTEVWDRRGEWRAR